MYDKEIKPICKKAINKACKNNPVLRKILETKMNEVILNPSHYKPLRYDLKGERRVHVMCSFVLKFKIEDNRKIITFLAFGHHDYAYKR